MPLMPFLVTDMTDFAFIDSGVGGIPYMLELLKKNPAASCIYVADTANFPYGEKSHEEVVACILPLVKKIKERFAPRVVVLACNTISVNALEVLRKSFPDTQFVGTVPAIKLAAGLSKTKKLGLLATKATVNNPYNTELMNKFAADCTLVTRGDSALVDFIEKNAFTAGKAQIKEALKDAVEFFRVSGCDVIILGCTHFLNIKEEFKEAAAPDITIVDSVDGVVRHTLELGGVAGEAPAQGVERKGLRSQGETAPSLFITGPADETYRGLCSRFGIKFLNF